jgi:hypothetical protein
MNLCRAVLIELGPYTAAALTLPGGTLFALVAWLWRHRSLAPLRRRTRHEGRAAQPDYRAATARAIAWLGDRYLLAEPVPPRYPVADITPLRQPDVVTRRPNVRRAPAAKAAADRFTARRRRSGVNEPAFVSEAAAYRLP